MIEQPGNTRNNCQTEPETSFRSLATFAQALELVEHDLLILGGNTHTRVDDLDGDVISPSPATYQDATGRRVATCVADEILHDTSQKRGIRADKQ